MKALRYSLATAAILAAASLGLASCTTTKTADCQLLNTSNLDTAMRVADDLLSSGCHNHFETYFAQLLYVAEGDPSPDNKQKFSDFLVQVTDKGLLSKRQAQKAYNRYFNVKFVSMMGDYNNCAATCPRKDHVLAEMQQELTHKELGLLRISAEPQGYYRADRLFQETELVLEATCTACAAGR
jgi:hypothetical protein